MRLTVCIDVGKPGEDETFAAWLRANATHVKRISENTGCGCCVLLYDVEVEEQAQPLPKPISAGSNWTSQGVFDGADSTVDEVLADLDIQAG